jgi:glucosamine--fructose-6-phosphate aminotransferase (isomerizing)
LNPVAYTYDWGMVTDLARRNISRMCEALQIEHILVAADIRRKREFIRMNVEAWLHRPHLGTIPLFMAGDKQFFYYSDMLSKQMNLPLVIFSQNRLERTDFKVGYCGINDTASYSKLHDLAPSSKIRMALFYAKEFALNPRLINASLIDSAAAYASYYLLPKRYIQLFDYIDWKEDVVEDTIINKYEWETSPDSHSTWRVGDGTASFYNYIYYKVTGFTEHDTFRSNQIRQGLISRGKAIKLLPAENEPRVDSFKWYCDTIGIDPLDAVQRINRMPRVDHDVRALALGH